MRNTLFGRQLVFVGVVGLLTVLRSPMAQGKDVDVDLVLVTQTFSFSGLPSKPYRFCLLEKRMDRRDPYWFEAKSDLLLSQEMLQRLATKRDPVQPMAKGALTVVLDHLSVRRRYTATICDLTERLDKRPKDRKWTELESGMSYQFDGEEGSFSLSVSETPLANRVDRDVRALLNSAFPGTEFAAIADMKSSEVLSKLTLIECADTTDEVYVLRNRAKPVRLGVPGRALYLAHGGPLYTAAAISKGDNTKYVTGFYADANELRESVFHTVRLVRNHAPQPVRISCQDIPRVAKQVIEGIEAGTVGMMLGDHRILLERNGDQVVARCPRTVPLKHVGLHVDSSQLVSRFQHDLTVKDGVFHVNLKLPAVRFLLPPSGLAATEAEVLDWPRDRQDVESLLRLPGPGAVGQFERLLGEVEATMKSGTPIQVRFPVRDAHDVTVSPALDSKGWDFDLRNALSEYKVEFSLKSPDPELRLEISSADWSIRDGAPSDSRLLATLDANGQLTFRAARRLAGHHGLHLHPHAGELGLNPVPIAIKEADLKDRLTAHYTYNLTRRMVTFKPSDFRGFAPAVLLEFRDGTRAELLDETDSLGCRPDTIRRIDARGIPSEVPGAQGLEVAVDDLVAITPLGLSSYGRTEIGTERKRDLLTAMATKDWKKVLQAQPGLDVYCPSGSTAAAIRSAEGRVELLTVNPLSSRYWTRVGLQQGDEWKLWDGSRNWIPLDVARPGHHRLAVDRPRTAYVLISACALTSGVAPKLDAPNARRVGDKPLKPSHDPLGFLDQPVPATQPAPEKEPSEKPGEVPPRTQAGPDESRPPQSVGRGRSSITLQQFSDRWMNCAPGLLEELRAGRFEHCEVMVIFTRGDAYEVSSLAHLDLKSSDVHSQLVKEVRENFRRASTSFSPSARVSRSPARLVEALEKRPPKELTVEPGSPVLVIVPDGQPKLQRDTRTYSVLRQIHVTGFCSDSPEVAQQLFRNSLVRE